MSTWQKVLSRWMRKEGHTALTAAQVLGYADRSAVDKQLKGEVVPAITRAEDLAKIMRLPVREIRLAIIAHQDLHGENESASGLHLVRGRK